MIWIVAVSIFFLWLRFYTLSSVWFTSRVSEKIQGYLDPYTLTLSFLAMCGLFISLLMYVYGTLVHDLGTYRTHLLLGIVGLFGLLTALIYTTALFFGPRGYLSR